MKGTGAKRRLTPKALAEVEYAFLQARSRRSENAWPFEASTLIGRSFESET